MSEETKTRAIHFRLTESLHAAIVRLAEAERRSVGNVLTLIIEQGLERFESPGVKASKTLRKVA